MATAENDKNLQKEILSWLNEEGSVDINSLTSRFQSKPGIDSNFGYLKRNNYIETFDPTQPSGTDRPLEVEFEKIIYVCITEKGRAYLSTL